jgi:hypothetical protein
MHAARPPFAGLTLPILGIFVTRSQPSARFLRRTVVFLVEEDGEMNRLCLPLLILPALLAYAANRAQAEDVLDADTMIVALHTNEIEDQGFIEFVVEQVNDGVLPADMVHSTFLWAKKKNHNKFQYFMYGLMYRAAKANIDITWPTVSY